MAAEPFAALRGHKYISLVSFRKNGAAVATPVWFAEQDGRLYVMTRSDSGKYKRIRNRPQVGVAPCTARGRVTGPEIAATAAVLPADNPVARPALARKYWLLRLSWLWSKKNIFLEIRPS